MGCVVPCDNKCLKNNGMIHQFSKSISVYWKNEDKLHGVFNGPGLVIENDHSCFVTIEYMFEDTKAKILANKEMISQIFFD